MKKIWILLVVLISGITIAYTDTHEKYSQEFINRFAVCIPTYKNYIDDNGTIIARRIHRNKDHYTCRYLEISTFTDGTTQTYNCTFSREEAKQIAHIMRFEEKAADEMWDKYRNDTNYCIAE